MKTENDVDELARLTRWFHALAAESLINRGFAETLVVRHWHRCLGGRELHDEAKQWLAEHAPTAQVLVGVVVGFTRPSEAVAFTMRWR